MSLRRTLFEYRNHAGLVESERKLYLPVTTHDWQLYHTYDKGGAEGKPQKGAAAAAKALTKALQQAEAEVRAAYKEMGVLGDPESLLARVFEKYIVPVQRKHAKVGADDTEPRTVAKDYLNQVANELGADGLIDF